MKTRERVKAGAMWAAVLLAVGIASALGSRGPGRIELDLGPGDSPYIRGFLPYYEVEGRSRTHWTTYDAEVELPLSLRGGPVTLSYRYARDFPQTAEVEIRLEDQTVDQFSARGGVFVERSSELAAVDVSPVRLSVLSDSHERRDMGLKLDWIRIDYGEAARARLEGVSLWRPLLLTLLCLAGFKALGWPAPVAALLCAAPAALLALGLARDPWTTHRFLTGLPLATAAYLALLLAIGWTLVGIRAVSARTLRLVGTLAFATFLLRAVLVSHPDFYYPDLRTHATLTGVLQGAGLDFLRHPAAYIAEHGKWVTEAYGETYAFPYTPAFHLGFALFPIPYDAVITWMKLAAAAVSTVPLVLVWAMARRLGVSVAGSTLMALVPTYTSRLSFAFLPSLFGHAFDAALLLWLMFNLDSLGSRRVWLAGAGFVAASQLAYVSGVLNVSLLLAGVVVIELARRSEEARRRALGAAVMLGLGSLVSFAIFYRDFLPMVTDVLRRAASGASGAAAAAESRYPVRSFLAVAFERTYGFFGALYPLLALVGARRLPSLTSTAPLLLAWALTYLVLLFGRAKMPDIFTHGHETLFVTPLVCLLAGAALGSLWESGGARRAGAAVALAVLALQGLYLQWQTIAAQLY